jgi:6-phosphogluconolactonase (cycloisomerase 2 family)
VSEAARRELAPHGVLRAAINLANPLLVSVPAAGEAGGGGAGPDGVAPALAAALAARLGVPLDLVPYPSPGVLGDRVDADEWDIALIAADPARAATMTFSPPYAEIAATYLVPPGSAVASTGAADSPGTKIVAIARSAYELWLTANLAHAEVVTAADAAQARQIFTGHDDYLLAGLAPALAREATALPGTRLLPGRFMAVQQAIATRPGSPAGARFVREFVEDARASGLVAELTRRFGVAGQLGVPGVRVPFFIGSYSVPSPWAGAAQAHGAGVSTAWLEEPSWALHPGPGQPDGPGPGEPVVNPAFIVPDRAAGRLWAITETEGEGELISFAIDARPGLRLAGRHRTGAVQPCHVTIDRPRRLAYVCHFAGGRLSLLSLGETGTPEALVAVTELPATARGTDRADLPSRPHCTVITDPGLTDPGLTGPGELLVTDHGRHLVALYRISGQGAAARLDLLDALPLPVPTGPRHIAFRPGSDIIYLSNENSASVSVLCSARLGPGAPPGPRLELAQTVPSPGLGRAGSLPAEIAVHPRLDVVYMANRRDESISVFAIDPAAGRLTHRQAVDVRGRWPRHFALSPDGAFLVAGNQDSDSVLSFRVLGNGDLEWTGHQLTVAAPANLRF